jgi:hypothetical protein
MDYTAANFTGWETLPYPPAQGDFAVYTIDDLESGINYAVKNVSTFTFMPARSYSDKVFSTSIEQSSV